jgi:pimeloyl-ACP methyl ester carboxylesterase
VIAVHGLGGSRADALQLLPTFHALGLPVLDITYGHSAVSRLGASEWRDLAAAVAYARTHGAANVVVFAYSMGAAIVEELFDHARRAPAVAALIFDSPLLDWKRTVASRVARRDLPAPLLDLALWIASARTGLHFRDVSLERFSRLLTVPTLIVHGTGDTVVPIETSDEFAAMKPRLVDYDRVAGVDHARAWNADPIAYERRLIGFLRRVGVTSARPRPAPPPC